MFVTQRCQFNGDLHFQAILWLTHNLKMQMIAEPLYSYTTQKNNVRALITYIKI